MISTAGTMNHNPAITRAARPDPQVNRQLGAFRPRHEADGHDELEEVLPVDRFASSPNAPPARRMQGC